MILHTFHIHFEGQVQGVGFRPFVYHMASHFRICGWANNATDGLHIQFNADPDTASDFYQQLLTGAPALARITRHTLREVPYQPYTDFKIIHSDSVQMANLLITPDFGLCELCRTELNNPQNRRYQYPFITCTECGPRFSIITRLPYDREFTTMEPFAMCPTCLSEYSDVHDRRYYSQTNSCETCGIQLYLKDQNGMATDQPLSDSIHALRSGKILAVKGIGGYLLLCDACNATAIASLRKRKNRPDKPLALMYPDLEQLQGDVTLTEETYKALLSPASPIVLLPLLDEPASGIQTQLIAPDLDQIGVMLPYTPLFELLAKGAGIPLVATSGNMSGAPVIFDDDKALAGLLHIADLLLAHNRNIVAPQDDSVIKYTSDGRKIVIRRSRGYAPTFLLPKIPADTGSVLALGAMMKSTFTWQHQQNYYISQYLGDLESFEAQESYQHTLKHFGHILNARPEYLLADLHPDCYATQFGEFLSHEWQIPLEKIQHHEAHFAAVLGENELLETNAPVLGVVWDGTGYGKDAQIWGGDFFTFAAGEINRFGQFSYFPCILGDKMPREPRISALSLTHGLPEAKALLQPKFTTTAWNLYDKILEKKSSLSTSSMGRIFDAVSCLLGLADITSYEGQAAMRLECLAGKYFRANGLKNLQSYLPLDFSNPVLPTQLFIQNLIADILKGSAKDHIAANFHYTLVQVAGQMARLAQCQQIAFSGGVFQNGVLNDLLTHFLGNEFKLFFHLQLSPNDENISFGQLMRRQIRLGKV